MTVHTAEYSSFFMISFAVLTRGLFIGKESELMIPVAHAEIDLLGAFIALIGKLLGQPFVIQSHAAKIFTHNPAVHYDLGMDEFGGRREIHIGGIDRAFVADRENGQPTVVFKDSGLDIAEIEIPQLAAHHHEFAQFQLRFFHIGAIELAVVHDDGGRAVDILACAGQFAREDRQKIGDQAVHYHRDQGLHGLFQLCCEFGGNGADGDACDVVKKIQLGDLLVSEYFGDQKQHSRREQRCQHNFGQFHF